MVRNHCPRVELEAVPRVAHELLSEGPRVAVHEMARQLTDFPGEATRRHREAMLELLHF